MTESKMTPAKATALRKPFPAESVGKLPKPYKRDSPKGNCNECGGYHGLPAVHLDYVGHAATTDRLLTVDPEWSWEPMGVDQYGLPMPDAAGNLWIRLTVCGVTRIGVGDGSSMKERIGDAIRNAAMRFGVALDLWAKEDLVEFAESVNARREEPAASAPATPPTADEELPPIAPEYDAGGHVIDVAGSPMKPRTRSRMFALFGELGIADADQLPGINHILGTAHESRKYLSEEQARTVIKRLEEKRNASRQESTA